MGSVLRAIAIVGCNARQYFNIARPEMRTLLAISLTAMLSACADAGTSASGVAAFQDGKPIVVQRAQSPDYDYVITIKNTGGLSFNPDDQAARDRVALSVLKDQCEAPEIIKERALSSGELFGGGSRTYEILVKC